MLYVGTDVGVYQTLDGGATWNPFQDGLPIVCNALRYVVDHTFAGNDKLIAATYGRGVYERAITAPGTAYVDPVISGRRTAPTSTPSTPSTRPDRDSRCRRLGLYQGTYIVAPLLYKRMKIHGHGGPVRLDR